MRENGAWANGKLPAAEVSRSATTNNNNGNSNNNNNSNKNNNKHAEGEARDYVRRMRPEAKEEDKKPSTTTTDKTFNRTNNKSVSHVDVVVRPCT